MPALPTSPNGRHASQQPGTRRPPPGGALSFELGTEARPHAHIERLVLNLQFPLIDVKGFSSDEKEVNIVRHGFSCSIMVIFLAKVSMLPLNQTASLTRTRGIYGEYRLLCRRERNTSGLDCSRRHPIADVDANRSLSWMIC